MLLDFYWDGAGDPRARPAAESAAAENAAPAAAPELVMSRYLESDVQGSVSQAREIVHVIDRILAGRLHTWSDTGNAYTLTLTRRGATIQLEADDNAPALRLSLADTRQAVADWLAFLQRGKGAAGAPAAVPAPPR